MDVAAAKRAFFDAKAVTDQIPPAVRRALSKFGAFVRRRAKSSLKYGTGSAAAGRPPVVHRSAGFTKAKAKTAKGKAGRQAASPLRELLFFAYDADRKSVVVGPVLGGSRTGAPAAMEHGGTTTVRRGGRRVTARYAPRPYMAPALAAEAGNAPDLFKNLIR